MEYINKFVGNFRQLYNGINAATLTGAIDVVIVQQEDGNWNGTAGTNGQTGRSAQ